MSQYNSEPPVLSSQNSTLHGTSSSGDGSVTQSSGSVVSVKCENKNIDVVLAAITVPRFKVKLKRLMQEGAYGQICVGQLSTATLNDTDVLIKTVTGK